MSTSFNLKISSVTAVVALTASPALSTTVDLTFDGLSSSPPAVVTIEAAPVSWPGSGNWPKNVYAAGLNMTDINGTLGAFLAWCLDLGSFLSTSSTSAKPYVITSDPFSNSFGLTPAEEARVQSMFDANFATLDETDTDEAAGFQLALWNSLYDNDLDVTVGIFKAAATSTIETIANTFLGAADTYVGGQKYALSFLESDPGNNGGIKYQNLVTASPVPVPAAGGLLVLALGGLMVARRRQRTV